MSDSGSEEGEKKVQENESSRSEEELKHEKDLEEAVRLLRFSLFRRMYKRDYLYCFCRLCFVYSCLLFLVYSINIGICIYVFVDSIHSYVNEIPKIEETMFFTDLNEYDLPTEVVCTQFPNTCSPEVNVTISNGKGNKNYAMTTFGYTDDVGRSVSCYGFNFNMKDQFYASDLNVYFKISVNVADMSGKCIEEPVVLLLMNSTQFAEKEDVELDDFISNNFSPKKMLDYMAETSGNYRTLLPNDALSYVKYQESYFQEMYEDVWKTSYPMETIPFSKNGVKCENSRCSFRTEVQVVKSNPVYYFVEFKEMSWYTPLFAVGGVMGMFSVFGVIIQALCTAVVGFSQKTFDRYALPKIVDLLQEKIGEMKEKKNKNKKNNSEDETDKEMFENDSSDDNDDNQTENKEDEESIDQSESEDEDGNKEPTSRDDKNTSDKDDFDDQSIL